MRFMDGKVANLVNNEPKLADFGLAKRDVDVTSRDSIESAKGTPAYMAPEVFQYAHRNMKMDVYSFGVVLNEVLTETIPFASYNKFQISHAVMTGERPEVFKSSTAASAAASAADSTSVRTLGSHETESIALTRIVMACWQGEPSLRPTFSNLVSYYTIFTTLLTLLQ
jgi:serine/threonine protein kinase